MAAHATAKAAAPIAAPESTQYNRSEGDAKVVYGLGESGTRAKLRSRI